MIRKMAIVCLGTVCLQPTVWAQDATPDETGPASARERAPERRSTSSSAFDGYYAGATVGPVFYRDNSIDGVDLDYDVGGQLAAFFGARYDRLRIEGEFATQGAEFDPSISRFDGDFNIFRAVASLYLDIAAFDLGAVHDVTPYIGGGLGIAFADIEGFDDDTAFTYHGEIGASFPVYRNIEVVPGYRYERSDFSDFEDDQEAHTIRASVRYNF